MTNQPNIVATVICSFPSKAYSVEFRDEQESVLITTVPCGFKDQAWAMADAFNHPLFNSNNWREQLTKPSSEIEENLEFEKAWNRLENRIPRTKV